MRDVVVDTSVIVKWFHTENETEVTEAKAVLDAHHDEFIRVRVLELVQYELGNVLLRALRWSARHTADQLDDLVEICGKPLRCQPEWRRQAARIAEAHKLSYYDACFVATAHALKAPLITADKKLLAANLGESPTEFAARFGLV